MTSKPNDGSGLPLVPDEVARFLEGTLGGDYYLLAQTQLSWVFTPRGLTPPLVVKVPKPDMGMPVEAAIEYHNMQTMQGVAPHHVTELLEMRQFDGGRYSCFVMPRYDATLSSVRGFLFNDMMGYIEQLLHAVRHMHAAGIVHLDLKAANIFIDWVRRHIRIGDFGMSIAHIHGNMALMRVHTVTTTTHRAPEHLVHTMKHDGTVQCFTHQQLRALDMWSVGVIIYEMLLKCLTDKGLFMGSVYSEPAHSTQIYGYYRRMLCDERKEGDPFDLLRFAPDNEKQQVERVLHLVERLMCWESAERWTAGQAHEYFMSHATVVRLPTSRYADVYNVSQATISQHFPKHDLKKHVGYVAMLSVYHYFLPSVSLEKLANTVMARFYTHAYYSLRSCADADTLSAMLRVNVNLFNEQLRAVQYDDQGGEIVAGEVFNNCKMLLE